jgi:hypothetical protein
VNDGDRVGVDIRRDSEPGNRDVENIAHGLLGTDSGNGSKGYANRMAATPSSDLRTVLPGMAG